MQRTCPFRWIVVAFSMVCWCAACTSTSTSTPTPEPAPQEETLPGSSTGGRCNVGTERLRAMLPPTFESLELEIVRQDLGEKRGVLVAESPAGATVWAKYEMITSEWTWVQIGADRPYGSWFTDRIGKAIDELASLHSGP